MYKVDDHVFAVCAYGESPHLRECVKSLMDQSVLGGVYISTSTPNDHIARVADEFQVELVINNGDPGIANDWNRAIEHSEVPLVTIAHQDDVYSPAYVEHMLEYCNISNRPLLFFTNYGEIRNGILVDDSTLLRVKRWMLAPLKISGKWGSKALRRRIISFGSPICCPSVTFCLPNISNPVFNNGMRGGLDWDAWERISSLTGDFIYDSEILMHHRIHEESETSSLIRDDTRSKEDLEMFRRFWPYPIAVALNKLYGISLRSNSID